MLRSLVNFDERHGIR